ncbi:MAG: glycosyltransferase family 4 protein [Bryobacterales bacterium]|nr:glycosyltransferase family 4 protein [Bryobacterales bacterium]
MDRFHWLSQTLEGDVLQPVWFRDRAEIEAEFGPGSYPVYARGRFRYHWFMAWRFQGLRRRVEVMRFYLRAGLRLLRERRYDCIVVYSHMATGVLAGVLKLLTGVNTVVEVVTVPNLAYLADAEKPGIRQRLLHLYSDICLHLSLIMGARSHLLYPSALAPYRLLNRKPVSVFHEFVPVSNVGCARTETPEGRYVLLAGAPWYLKGADLLIQAFRNINADFPDLKLKILGHFENRRELDALIAGSRNIEILKPRPNPEAIKIIASAAVMVLPSRCEGMGRVLLEAMSAGVPVIGSDTGGIPFLLKDGQCGLIFRSGDAAELEQRLRELLASAELRERLSQAGLRRARCELSEKHYVERFTAMIEAAARS